MLLAVCVMVVAQLSSSKASETILQPNTHEMNKPADATAHEAAVPVGDAPINNVGDVFGSNSNPAMKGTVDSPEELGGFACWNRK